MTSKIKHEFKNESSKDEHVMTLSGVIGEESWFYEAVSAKSVREALEGVEASTIRIKLNSGGGDAMQGIEIMNYLKDLDKYVIVEVTALAASAASIIAMGADEVIMREGATMMVHEAATFAQGTKTDIQKTMNALEAIDQSLVELYVNKTGLPSDDIRNMLIAETWMTGEEAVEKGFANSVHKEKVVDEVSELKEQLKSLTNQVSSISASLVIKEEADIKNVAKVLHTADKKRKALLF